MHADARTYLYKECANLITIAEVLLSNPVNLELSSSVGWGAVNKVRYNKTWLEAETHTAPNPQLEGTSAALKTEQTLH